MTPLSPAEARAFGKVGVLFGGRSAEREISIMSGNGVLHQAFRCVVFHAAHVTWQK